MDFAAFLDDIRGSPDYAGQIVHVEELEAREAQYDDAGLDLAPRTREVLDGLGIARLYTHQAEAVRRVLAGENVCVVASTAGGKTLCYTIPIAQQIYQRPVSRAFLVFPTKALAQDQLRKLADFGAGTAFTADCYDGDTPRPKRRQIKRDAQVVLTNPDMLHIGILPYHQTWADFLRNLKYVILDEVHTYRGVFGSHTANVIRRLRRLAAHYGANPQFVACSATIANPGELAERLIGLPVTVVDNDGSPRGRKLFALWNPPETGRGRTGRRSANLEAADLLCELVRRGVRNITFTIARMVAELVLRYARERLGEDNGLADRIMAYRGGYLPEERREIERKLFEGELLGVTATNALELGIDVGHLEAVVLTGYPGSIASVWQQAGRAGRTQDESLAVLVALQNGIDQFLVRDPGYIFRTDTERAIIDPENEFILAAHLLCAAYELPVAPSEAELFGPKMEPVMELLEAERFVTKRQKWYWIRDFYPAAQVNVRSASGASFEVIKVHHGKRDLLGTIDGQSAPFLAHEGAIYLHAGESYIVKKHDLEQSIIEIAPTKAQYYTTALVRSEVRVVERAEEGELPGGRRAFGDVEVRDQVTGFQKRRQVTEQILGDEDLDLPPHEFETQGLWLSFDARLKQLLADHGCDVHGSLHGLEHNLIALLPLFALCDPQDAGGASAPAHPDVGGPAVFLYDNYPGGVGICQTAYERLDELIAASVTSIGSCPCAAGCPSCVQAARCGDMNWPLDKQGALLAARLLLGEQDDPGATEEPT